PPRAPPLFPYTTLFRSRAMLSTTAELRHVGEASTGVDALKAMDALKPDLVLMDVHMPDMDGPTTARAVLAKYPATKVVAWTVSRSEEHTSELQSRGHLV